MNPAPIQPVILCGGSGTRLWPLSRAGFPKQFLNLLGRESLFQQAVQRLSQLYGAAPLVVGNEEHRFLMLEQCREMSVDPAAILLEPAARNTAPALTLAACETRNVDPVLVVAPADQTISDRPAFLKTLNQAIEEAAKGTIVVLGVSPTRPETGYGYIRAAAGDGARGVEKFVEKPDFTTARRYLSDGRYFWNSGIFVLKASTWMSVLTRFRPDIAKAATYAWQVRTSDAKFIRPGKTEFEAVPAESIDYAVMEKCPENGVDIRMLPLSAGWSDLGSWEAVWQAGDKDAAGNISSGDTLVSSCNNVLVHASDRLVSVVGLEGVIVVETADAVLVADRARSEEVKHLVTELKARDEREHHRKVHRPWGWYDTIDEGKGFKVKRIWVKPGESLSLQKHRHRAEHWVVVSGTAEITCSDKTLFLKENQSTYIPSGETHRLANPGTVPLEIIEVQSGDYLGEDDIERLEDNYGRG